MKAAYLLVPALLATAALSSRAEDVNRGWGISGDFGTHESEGKESLALRASIYHENLGDSQTGFGVGPHAGVVQGVDGPALELGATAFSPSLLGRVRASGAVGYGMGLGEESDSGVTASGALQARIDDVLSFILTNLQLASNPIEGLDLEVRTLRLPGGDGVYLLGLHAGAGSIGYNP